MKTWTRFYKTLGPAIKQKQPTLGPVLNSTAYGYMCIYIYAPRPICGPKIAEFLVPTYEKMVAPSLLLCAVARPLCFHLSLTVYLYLHAREPSQRKDTGIRRRRGISGAGKWGGTWGSKRVIFLTSFIRKMALLDPQGPSPPFFSVGGLPQRERRHENFFRTIKIFRFDISGSHLRETH